MKNISTRLCFLNIRFQIIKGKTLDIRKTCPCNEYPRKPHFYTVKLGFTGVYLFFFIFAPKYRLWVLAMAVLTCTHNLCFEQK